MYRYKVKIGKVSGRLNESVLPKKNLVVKHKTKKSKSQIFGEVEKYLKENYGLQLISARIICESFDPNDPEFIRCVKLIKQWHDNAEFIKWDPETHRQISEPERCNVAASFGEDGTISIWTKEEKIELPKCDCKISHGSYVSGCVFVYHKPSNITYIIREYGRTS